MSSVRVGTSGWGYPSWQPGFYPPGLDRSGFLMLPEGLGGGLDDPAEKARMLAEGEH